MIKINVDYIASDGEYLVLRTGKTTRKMKLNSAAKWEASLEKAPEKYSFEVWRDGQCVRKEWKGHTFPKNIEGDVEVRDFWADRPANSEFYSSLFKEVVFGRKVRKSDSGKGNVTFMITAPEVRPDMAVAITGSGKMFEEWTKMLVMSDENFPEWSLTLNVKEPFEYKFVVVDRKTHNPLLWEPGGNRYLNEVPAKSRHLVLNCGAPSFPFLPWRGAGTAVPVFSLRTEDSFGVGEFNDLKKLVDWAQLTGQNLIQLLPINDTTMTGKWQDSYPYNANTTFALHPQFIHLPDVGVKVNKAYKKLKDELNALPSVDYEKVNNTKLAFLHGVYDSEGEKTTKSKEYKAFMEANEDWLIPYAVFCCLRDENGTPDFSQWGKYAKYTTKKVQEYVSSHASEVEFWCFVQYHLDRQLKEVVAYAHEHGVGLKGDLPIGISRTSVDAWAHTELFHMDSQAGAPPDAFSVFGQNWGFPTYNWEKMSEDGFAWWKSRMRKMGEYFDAFRIDHILGFFRIWEIPMTAVHGLLGYFNPALPYSAKELSDMGFDMSGKLSAPLTDDWVLNEIFGPLADEVRKKYIKGGKLAASVENQKKMVETFVGDDDKTVALRNGFMTLLDDVLFIEDPRKKGYFHPRIAAHSTYQYRALAQHLKERFNALYTDFFYYRHNGFWRDSAMFKLPSLLDTTDMLTCGEDLGMIPACVPDVMKELNVLSLEIQRMPKSQEVEFGNPAEYPYMSVCATGSHDTSNIRAWWEEDRELTSRFYHNVLGRSGEVPYFCEPWICEEIVNQHVKSPSMLCVLPLQDWLSIDGQVRYQGDPSDERINVPAIPRYYWRYRMHLTIEELISKTDFNKHLKMLITTAARNR